MGTWPQQKQNENTKKKRNPFLSGGFIKCFRGVAFYFFKDKGSDWKTTTTKKTQKIRVSLLV